MSYFIYYRLIIKINTMEDVSYGLDLFFKNLNDTVQAYQTILIVSLIINIVVLICFFILCSNVSKIKHSLSGESSFESSFWFLVSVNEKERAKKLLIDKMMNDANLDQCFFKDKSMRDLGRRNFEDIYKKYMDSVGGIGIDYTDADKAIQ